MGDFGLIAMSWLAQNSAGLQALAAIFQFLVAVFIAIITRRYVLLTAQLLETSKTQVRISETQLRIQGQALRSDLYERRLKIYGSVRGFLSKFMREIEVKMDSVADLVSETREAAFLLESQTIGFIDEIRDKALKHRALSINVNRMEKGLAGDMAELLKIQHEMFALQDWLLQDAFTLLDEHFKPYLRFEENQTRCTSD